MSLDAFKNLCKVTVSTGYNSSATSIVLASGDGAKLPAVPFNVVWYNATDYTDPSDDPNVEIVRVTGRSTDTLTVTRGQEGIIATSKNTGGKTYLMMATLTAKTLTDIGTYIGRDGSYQYVISTDGTTTYALNATTGVVDYSGTDAGPVFRSVVTAMGSTAGKAYVQPGIYNVNTLVHETAAGYNHYYAVGFPANAGSSNQYTSLGLVGGGIPTGGGLAANSQTVGVIIRITSTAVASVPVGSLLVGLWHIPDTVNAYGNEIYLEELSVEFPDNQRGNTIAYAFYEASTWRVRHCLATFTSNAWVTTPPVNGSAGSIGFVTPKSSKNNYHYMEFCWSNGYFMGYQFLAEHTITVGCTALLCNISMRIGNNTDHMYHPIIHIKFTDQWCINGPQLYMIDTGSRVDFMGFDLEFKNSGSFARATDATELTPGTTLGTYTYSSILAGVGLSAHNFWQSGSGGNFKNLDSSGGGGAAPNTGCRIYAGTTQSLASGAWHLINLDTADDDAASMHSSATGTLTGTLHATAGSQTVTGSGTLFTSELVVGQVIAIPAAADGVNSAYCVVIAIASDTSMTVANQTKPGSTQSSAACTHVNGAVVFRTAGRYTISWAVGVNANTLGQGVLAYNGDFINTGSYLSVMTGAIWNSASSRCSGTTVKKVNQWDYVVLNVLQLSGSSQSTFAGIGETYIATALVG